MSRWEGKLRGVRVATEVRPGDMLLPRVSVQHWDDDDELSISLELGVLRIDPLFILVFVLPWRRPRPWYVSGTWPGGGAANEFCWRKPR